MFSVQMSLAQSVYFRHFTIRDGLPHNQVYNTFQDSEGFMWFCTDDGLVRFDGRNMQVYQQEQGLKSNFVIDITESESGKKYIATWKGGVHVLDNDTIYPIETEKGYDYNSSYIRQVGDSVIYAAQAHIFVILKKKNGEWVGQTQWPRIRDGEVLMGNSKLPPHIKSKYTSPKSITVQYVNDQLYIHGIEGGLWLWDGRENQPMKSLFSSVIKGRVVHSFHIDRSGNVWLGFIGEIVKIAPNGHYTWYRDQIPEQYIKTIFSSPDGKKIGFNTSSDGIAEDNIYLLNEESGFLFDLKRELGFVSSPSSLFFDKDGNYWITTIGEGVYWVLDRPYDFYTLRDNDTKFVYDILEGDRDHYWLATKSGIYVLDHTSREITEYLRMPLTRFVFRDDLSKQIYSTSNVGIYKGKKVIYNDGFQTKPVWVVDQIIVSSLYSRIFKIDIATDEVSVLAMLDLDRGKRIRQLLANDSTVWAATEDGVWELNYLQQDTLMIKKKYTTKEGLPSDRCYDIKMCKEGKLWIATERGVAILNGDRFEKVTELPSVRCLKLLHDHRNHVWIATTNGLLYYDGKKYVPFAEETGLLASDVNCLIEDKHNRIWIGSSKGLTILDNNSYHSLAAPPLLKFIPPKRETYKDSEQIRLAFSAINYESPKSTIYRYRLNDEKWLTTTNPFVEYNALAAGKYQFEVQAKKINSNWGPSHVFSFHTIAPWYLRWWAVILELSLFILIVFWVARNRIKQANAVSQRLRSEIHQRITMENQLAEVRNQIARDFHDEMGNKLASITVLSNLISFKLNNPQPDIAELLGKIEQSSKQLYRGTKDFIWSIDTKSDNVMELFTYLRDFGESFYQPLEIDFYVETTCLDQFEQTKLPLHWSRQIVLIFKEAMTNVAKYAKCSSVWFYFGIAENTLQISIKDNGVGFDLSKESKGNGLRNMRERAEKVACQLELISSSEGTEVRFTGQFVVK